LGPNRTVSSEILRFRPYISDQLALLLTVTVDGDFFASLFWLSLFELGILRVAAFRAVISMESKAFERNIVTLNELLATKVPTTLDTRVDLRSIEQNLRILEHTRVCDRYVQVDFDAVVSKARVLIPL
jgi:hypothetical protein